jgi:hypothetical protein
MVKGHQEVSPTACPGPLMAQYVDPYRAGSIGPVPSPTPAPNPDVLTITRPDGKSFDVAYGFLHNLYERVPQADRLRILGYPESGDVLVLVTDANNAKWQGRGQFWERGVMLHDPRQPPGPWQDTMARADQMITQIPEAH